MAEEIYLPHFPPDDLVLFISLYKSVQNAGFLREQLLAGNQEFNYAFVDASMILSRTHLLAACFRAVNDYYADRLRSNNIHSEIVLSLNGSNNIGEAFSKFGIPPSSKNGPASSGTTMDLLVIKAKVKPKSTISTGTISCSAQQDNGNNSEKNEELESEQSSIAARLDALIDGQRLPFSDEILLTTCDWARVRKAYKIPPPPLVDGAGSVKKKAKERGARRGRSREEAEDAQMEDRPTTPSKSDDREDRGEGEAFKKEKEEARRKERSNLERAALGTMALRGAT